VIGWLTRLFGAAPPQPPAPPPAPAPVAPPAPAAGAPLHAAAIDRRFFYLLGAAQGQVEVEAAAAADTTGLEKTILDEMARLVRDPYSAAGLVPRVPAVIPQLLGSLRDEGLSGTELARQVAQDVVLVAEVIREANSPYYRPAQPVKTIEGAVMLLGQNGLRMLLARVAFRPVIGVQSGRYARQAAPLVWTQSEQCALAANTLAAGQGANAFDAYLAGLMHNIGLIVAFRVIDQVLPPAAPDAIPGGPAFCAALLEQARQLSSVIAGEWNFPVTVSTAISTPRATPLGLALAMGDRVAKLRVLVDAGVLAQDAALAGLDPALLQCFDLLHAKVD
jgi:HD-like signal output (HDOD) protein